MTPAFFSAETRTYCFFFRKHGENTIEIRNLLTCAFGKKRTKILKTAIFATKKCSLFDRKRGFLGTFTLRCRPPSPFPPPPDMHFTSFPMRQPMAQGKEQKRVFCGYIFPGYYFWSCFPLLAGRRHQWNWIWRRKIESRDSSSWLNRSPLSFHLCFSRICVEKVDINGHYRENGNALCVRRWREEGGGGGSRGPRGRRGGVRPGGKKRKSGSSKYEFYYQK